MVQGFTGEFEHTLDTKGRVILPASFREELAEGLVLAPAANRCLDVFRREDWEQYVARLRALEDGPRKRDTLRFVMARAHTDTLDAQGRITVPPRLREYAGLGRELTITGVWDRVNIWDRQAWEAYCGRVEPEVALSDLLP